MYPPTGMALLCREAHPHHTTSPRGWDPWPNFCCKGRGRSSRRIQGWRETAVPNVYSHMGTGKLGLQLTPPPSPTTNRWETPVESSLVPLWDAIPHWLSSPAQGDLPPNARHVSEEGTPGQILVIRRGGVELWPSPLCIPPMVGRTCSGRNPLNGTR